MTDWAYLLLFGAGNTSSNGGRDTAIDQTIRDVANA